MRMSIQAELDTFFAHLRQQAQLVHVVSEQVFAQARAKLSLTAIPGLNNWIIARAGGGTGLCRAGAGCAWSPTPRRCVRPAGQPC